MQHRLSHGINVKASYTFSKALDTSDSYSSAVDPFLNPRSRNYGPAGYDRRQVFTSSFYYNLPKPGRRRGSGPWVGSRTTGNFPASRACSRERRSLRATA